MSRSSITVDVLGNAESLQKESARLEIIARKTRELQAEVNGSLQKKYVDFYSTLKNVVDLNDRVQNLSSEMQIVATKVEQDIKAQLTASATELEDVSSKLSESSAALCILERLVIVDRSFRECATTMRSKNYQSAAASLAEINGVLTDSSGPRDGEIKIFQVIHSKYSIEHNKLLADVTKAWLDMVKWEISKNYGELNNAETTKMILCLKREVKPKLMTVNMVQAMQDLKILEQQLSNFADRLLKFFIDPILSYSELQIKLDNSEESNLLTLTGRKREKSENPAAKLHSTLEEIFNIMRFLYKSFFRVKVRDDGRNVSLMHLLGSLINKEMIDLIITKCLSLSIPSNSRDLENYVEIINITETFQNLLIKMHFLPPNNSDLSDYVNDLNLLFANKKCQEILEKARSLMTSEIHDMVKITAVNTDDLPALGLEGTSSKCIKSENMHFSGETTLSTNTFQLPTCCISICVKDLVDLAYQTLHEATSVESTDQCCIQLFYSVRYMLMLFTDVVPTYHRDNLENLPQVAALHHNNCMYIAHHLVTMGHQFRPNLPSPLSQGAATFIDLIPKLRRLGIQSFLHQLTKQKELMSDCLPGADDFVNVGEYDNSKKCERAIKQLLYQLQRLCNVWCQVLPANTYYRSIGILLNTAVVEITSKVMSLEDISADDANQLHNIMSLITKEAASFFQIETNEARPSNIELLLLMNICKWDRFTKLMWVLNTGLQDISDRWADGIGPLAIEFQASEMKLLIRALFQNTDKRSKILLTIK